MCPYLFIYLFIYLGFDGGYPKGYCASVLYEQFPFIYRLRLYTFLYTIH